MPLASRSGRGLARGICDPGCRSSIRRRWLCPSGFLLRHASRVAPRLDAETIQAMQAQRAALREARIVEILVRVVHADAFHHGARCAIENGREGDDFSEADALETDSQGGSRRFRGVALAPVRTREPPADLDAGRERKHPTWNRETDKTDELGRAPDFHRPVAPPAPGQLRLPRVDARVAAFAADPRGKEAHHFGVGVERGERLAIGVTPLAQAQARGLELDDSTHEAFLRTRRMTVFQLRVVTGAPRTLSSNALGLPGELPNLRLTLKASPPVKRSTCTSPRLDSTGAAGRAMPSEGRKDTQHSYTVPGLTAANGSCATSSARWSTVRTYAGSVSPHSACSVLHAAARTRRALTRPLSENTSVPLVWNDAGASAPAAANASSSCAFVGQFGRPRFTLRKKAAYFTACRAGAGSASRRRKAGRRRT